MDPDALNDTIKRFERSMAEINKSLERIAGVLEEMFTEYYSTHYDDHGRPR